MSDTITGAIINMLNQTEDRERKTLLSVLGDKFDRRLLDRLFTHQLRVISHTRFR